MRRFLLLLVLTVAACNGTSTPAAPPPLHTPTVASLTQTPISPTSVSDTPAASAVSPTETSAATITFPDPNAYTWQAVVTGLQRPVDLQPDGSGRLFVIEKAGRIRILQNGQLAETPFLDISERVNSQ